VSSRSERQVDGMDRGKRYRVEYWADGWAVVDIERPIRTFGTGLERREAGEMAAALNNHRGAVDVVDAVENLMRVMDAGSYARPAEPWLALRDALDAYRRGVAPAEQLRGAVEDRDALRAAVDEAIGLLKPPTTVGRERRAAAVLVAVRGQS
jgi:hypothetical protein